MKGLLVGRPIYPIHGLPIANINEREKFIWSYNTHVISINANLIYEHVYNIINNVELK